MPGVGTWLGPAPDANGLVTAAAGQRVPWRLEWLVRVMEIAQHGLECREGRSTPYTCRRPRDVPHSVVMPFQTLQQPQLRHGVYLVVRIPPCIVYFRLEGRYFRVPTASTNPRAIGRKVAPWRRDGLSSSETVHARQFKRVTYMYYTKIYI